MQLRFLAAAGDGEQLPPIRDRAAKAGLVERLRTASLSVWTYPETLVVLGPGRSILIGWLYDRESREQVGTLPDIPDLEAHLLGRHWGAYVLFAADGSRHLALREPSGSVPVYHAAAGGVSLYASDAALLKVAMPRPMSPDFHFIRHWLTFPYLRGARTGAEGVLELLPGTCRRADGAQATIITSWSPFDHVHRGRAVVDFESAARMLRKEALAAIPRLAPPDGRIVLQLSGGLDSSIVAASLSTTGRKFSAVTFATRAGDGDERRYARASAKRTGAELVELIEEDLPVDPLDLAEADPLRPGPNPLLRPLHRALAAELARSGADCVLDGAGGDNLFGYLNTASPVVDAFRQAGLGTGLGALHDLANLHGANLWSVAGYALRRALRRAAPVWRRDESFLAPGAAVSRPDDHPWLNAPAGIPAGAADHVRTILGIHHFLSDSQPGAPLRLHPLLAQPLLELCLGIPSWLWFHGGRDRAVAREAFRNMVPDAILDRRGKGRLESMFMKGYRSVRPRLEPFLRDGRLAAAGIIDGAAVSSYLRRPGEPRDAAYIRLLEIASAEQWLRSFDR